MLNKEIFVIHFMSCISCIITKVFCFTLWVFVMYTWWIMINWFYCFWNFWNFYCFWNFIVYWNWFYCFIDFINFLLSKLIQDLNLIINGHFDSCLHNLVLRLQLNKVSGSIPVFWKMSYHWHPYFYGSNLCNA